MAPSPILVDSCWYITQTKQQKQPLKELASVALVRDVAICGVVRAEVARGVKTPSILKRYIAAWDVMLNIPTDNKLWDDVEKTVWNLDRKGLILPLTDVIIACCARRIGAVVLTYDKHFHAIPGIIAADRIV